MSTVHDHLPAPCHLVERASSSLDVAHEYVRNGTLPLWGSVLVMEQTAGRGQLRRQWASPRGNIYAALRLPKEGPFLGLEAAPALGLLIAQAFHEQGIAVSSKWPNDIIQRNTSPSDATQEQGAWQKVGGILLEERGDALVAGIGINIVSAPSSALLRENHAFAAGVLQMRDRIIPSSVHNEPFDNIVHLWTDLAASLFSCYGQLNLGNTHPAWLSLVPRYLAFLGKRVRLTGTGTGHDMEGILDGIDPNGALRLLTTHGMQSFLNGSLSLL